MQIRKQSLWIFFLAIPLVLVLMLMLGAFLTQVATAYALECQTCHDQLASVTSMRQCEACHKGSDIRLIVAREIALYHENHFGERICYTCILYQHDTDEIVDFRKNLDDAGGDGTTALEGWSMTSDLPNWNALIDERLSMLQNDE